MFQFSSRSLQRLEGVNADLVQICHKAIKTTSVDFGITQGLRTLEEQRKLVDSGASRTMKSKHLEGRAVDVVAYIGPRVSWELPLYCEIAEAFREAAQLVRTKVRWGGAWHCNNICDWNGSMEDLLDQYIDLRRSQGRRPFIDAPHFEL